jgi:molybdopterin molybdotransferase
VATGDVTRNSTEPARRFISFDDARATILAAAAPLLMPTEFVPIDDAFGRTLREDLVATEPNPAFANSAMDGFAVRSSDVASPPASLRVIETVPAGRVSSRSVGPGEAIRIMTGAALPAGADAVVPVERTTSPSSNSVEVLVAVARGEHVRPAGEDFAAGERLVTSGRVVDPGVIAILAALGHPVAEVSLLPRVAIISTGDELVEPGQPVGPGQIRDSNTHTIRAMVHAAGCEPGPCWHVIDDAEAVSVAVRRVVEHCEVIVTLGGVSAGDFDPVKQALSSLGSIELWKVGMKPGQPQAFGMVAGKLFFGLPGNPVSSAVVFEMLVRPALWTLLGRSVLDRPMVKAVSNDPFSSVQGRRDFIRVCLEPWQSEDATTAYRVQSAGNQSSGAVSTLVRGNGLMVIDESLVAVASGTRVDVLIWNQSV